MKTIICLFAVLLAAGTAGGAEEESASTNKYRNSEYGRWTFWGMPSSKLPGSFGRRVSPGFVLTDTNSLKMTGVNDPLNERWCDIAGNIYSTEFIRGFDYEKPSTNGPVVRVKVDPESTTFSGRLEARGLKPNFAYQVKLRGVFGDRKSFEAIGYAGRWRLPGIGTNYEDTDYEDYANKEEVEAYLLFDFFITDSSGNAVKAFALDSCLHVLWSGSHQQLVDRAEDAVHFVVKANDPRYYARPKTTATIERVWAEREMARYKSEDQVRFLPPGKYKAEVVLTEESFHSWYRDGGYWATVCKALVEFTVLPEKGEMQPAGKAAD